MSSNNSSSGNSNRNGFIFPDFSLRRLLLQTRTGRTPFTTRMCDVERGGASNPNSGVVANGIGNSANSNKHEKTSHGSALSNGSSGSGGSGVSGGDVSSGKSNADALTQNQRTHASSSTSSSSSTHQHNGNNQRINSSGSSCGGGSGGAGSNSSSNNSTNNNNRTNRNSQECPLCYSPEPSQGFYTMLNCKHYACRSCLESYLTIEIFESRTEIACTQCSDAMHPSDIETLLRTSPTIMKKYEDFMVRRVLLSDPDSRWCPAPDCSYAVIATGCASCPRIKCERPGCDVNFCYHCKAEWHPDQTCDAARASRQSPMRAPSGSISQDSQHRTDDIKPCPRCQVLIVKMDDGSCNHMVCAVCGSEFCWLCMKEISDLHYLSPSGCTFWGKKPWSRKKKLLWQLGTLVGAPVGIALVAGIAVPAMIIGIPVWIGRKLHTRYRLSGKHKRNFAMLGGVAASILVSPVLAGLAVAIGVPILLFYVYGVVPVSLCRAGCAVSTTRDGFKFDFDEEDNSSRNHDAASVDAVSRIGATSIGEVSLSVVSGSQLGASSHNNAFTLAQSNANRESTTALSGSITGNKMEVQADVSASETASAVTCVSEKSNNTQNDNASTRALAGSMYKQHIGSSNVSEDGASERVRFDNIVYYSMDEAIEKDANNADKTSVSSERSFKLCGDDGESAGVTSYNKRNRLSQQNRNAGIAKANPPETDQLIVESDNTKDAVTDESTVKTQQPSKLSLNLNQTADPTNQASTSDTSNSQLKNMSKAAVLRHLFFSPISSNNNAATAETTPNVACSRETN
ncbi:E3 ubiquitin-protein ligase RNF19B-like [Sitodiplosis mosellana]|uniref:E3 ubiquitin-protein ligase RNF19B-like n=1 Tax=Sitodiplosis mosellana TaxID=263140 RepID=UPI0024444372|nr:E3 ubiquitin-protein ligase RNF19B-like [Sitodiplosis mosellana]XP_055325035.1 E3 ubiquitin-protein ligase RNF19B-like [Sitodiplosis mosellana]XP_055325036.1 E3 ubiquitin-protein ligase RNF19B-like [Sitodiplosis mosellana]XP_055325037.1 E3 ubiquitin-protein ligase RNF19B-like [Sitodiplosis mosellana]XP_055325038.1 E3 ubiquitin-protein ligase RNF19B-like [Sitodiplosis mosellana]